MRLKETFPITCPMCGHIFDPSGNRACAACPLQKGCQLICCPQCGYELVDINHSWLAQSVAKLLFRKESRSPGRPVDSLPPGQDRSGA